MAETFILAQKWKSSNIRSTNMHIGYAPKKFSVDYTYKKQATTKFSGFLDKQNNRYKINLFKHKPKF